MQPLLALARRHLLPEREHVAAPMLLQKPRRIAEAAIDPHHHPRRLPSQLDQPLHQLRPRPPRLQPHRARPALLRRSRRPHPRPDMPPLPRRHPPGPTSPPPRSVPSGPPTYNFFMHYVRPLYPGSLNVNLTFGSLRAARKRDPIIMQASLRFLPRSAQCAAFLASAVLLSLPASAAHSRIGRPSDSASTYLDAPSPFDASPFAATIDSVGRRIGNAGHPDRPATLFRVATLLQRLASFYKQTGTEPCPPAPRRSAVRSRPRWTPRPSPAPTGATADRPSSASPTATSTP